MRGLRQQLESLSAAGLTHLPRVHLPEPPRKPALATVTEPAAATPAPLESPSRSRSALIQPVQDPMAPRKAAATGKHLFEPAAPQKSAILAASGPSTRAERQDALAMLANEVKACTRCAELASTRTQTVFGVGNPEARILFIGEAPGADEDARGEPFVGRAGQLLNQIITASRLKREEIYICNILKCRPPGNRTPQIDECANCRGYLLGQLATIDPEYIVCWGTVAAQNLLASPLTIGKLRGKFLQFGRAKVLCTYHPSYLLRNPAAKKDVWQDMQYLMADMGVNLTAKSP
jgi:uracil-DNA glycosylase